MRFHRFTQTTFRCVIVSLLQLRAARYEMYDIFFCLSVAERMHLISLDRELARERVLRRQVTDSFQAMWESRWESHFMTYQSSALTYCMSAPIYR